MSKIKTQSNKSKLELTLATLEERGQIERHSRFHQTSTSMTKKIEVSNQSSSNTLVGFNIQSINGNGTSLIQALRAMGFRVIGVCQTKSTGLFGVVAVIKSNIWDGQRTLILKEGVLFVSFVAMNYHEKKDESVDG